MYPPKHLSKNSVVGLRAVKEARYESLVVNAAKNVLFLAQSPNKSMESDRSACYPRTSVLRFALSNCIVWTNFDTARSAAMQKQFHQRDRSFFWIDTYCSIVESPLQSRVAADFSIQTAGSTPCTHTDSIDCHGSDRSDTLLCV